MQSGATTSRTRTTATASTRTTTTTERAFTQEAANIQRADSFSTDDSFSTCTAGNFGDDRSGLYIAENIRQKRASQIEARSDMRISSEGRIVKTK
eukprot:9085357-Heterocapsa_arctica.AAC.1